MLITADEFTCTGCGCQVFSTPPRDPPPTQCAYCNMLDEFVADPKEREELRQLPSRRFARIMLMTARSIAVG